MKPPTLTACFLLAVLLFFSIPTQAQPKSKLKGSKITAADFDLSKAKFDTSANAVVIEDVGNTSFIGNTHGDFNMVFTRRTRVKILNKNGFDAATRTISLYGRNADQEKLLNLKASTYNLEGGLVTETKLNEKDVFTERVSKERIHQKFTLPALKEGSIFEVSYSISSAYYTLLRSWDFQGDYPCLYSEYEVVIPSFFNYMTASQGDQTFIVNTAKSVSADYNVHEDHGTGPSESYLITSTALDRRWVKTEIPALKPESYTSTVDNHVSRVAFQLHYIQYSETAERHNFLSDWYIASEKLMKDDNFGIALEYDNHWMKEPLAELTAGAKTPLDKARMIFCNVRDHFSCTEHRALYAYSSLKDVYKKKSGNVAEVNLLLTAMLRNAGFESDPAILSTRENGFAHPTYPMISEYDYVVCQLRLNGKTYNLDASCSHNGFGYLPTYCYNGEGRVINKEKPYVLELFPDSLRESKMTNVFILNDDKGSLSGSLQTYLTEDESFSLRDELKETSQKEYFKKIQASYGAEFDLQSPGIDSLTIYEKPIKVHYDFVMNGWKNNDVVYFNPMFGERLSKNPFASEKRLYDVEMPYVSNKMFILNMQIPEGFKVEEMPKSERVMYNENDGMFEYLIGISGDMLQMKVTLKFNKATIPVEEYGIIRDFFAHVVKKENEQIVFKKIK